ncbi:L-serine ammonia-lyase [Apiospora kogelbergensis]|uniref:L-serine ammonia-lyase n=1 Tax=Apiospora kogelbergensis TaxID=1337665 RepID=UPI00312FE426
MMHRSVIRPLCLLGRTAIRSPQPSLAPLSLIAPHNAPRRAPLRAATTATSRHMTQARRYSTRNNEDEEGEGGTYSEADHEHAVISTFDLFSIGIGPSSSHTVGPMRAGNIFITDLIEAGLLQQVDRIRISLYGSLALTGEGHMTPSALLLGLESANVESVDTAYVPERFIEIKEKKKLYLGHGLAEGQGKEISFDYDRDFTWEWGKKLPLHSNGMRFRVFDKDGYMIATNDLFSVGGGFVVNGSLSINPENSPSDSPAQGSLTGTNEAGHPADLAENMFYKEIRRADAAGDRKTGAEVKLLDGSSAESAEAGVIVHAGADDGSKDSPSLPTSDDNEANGDSKQPRYAFRDASSLLALCKKHNLTIAQLVYENEKSHGYTDDEIHDKVFRIWETMDHSILEGVQAPSDARRAGIKLWRQRGETSGLDDFESFESFRVCYQAGHSPRVHGSLYHPVMPSPLRRTTFPAMDHLSVYAMAVNETNAAGGRIVTAPTNGAAGIIPAVLKYTVEFVSDDPERDILTFLLTASAIGMLYKRGATISAAEGGCMAEVGVACSMAAGAFAACMGASPETIQQAAEIGIEHNLGLTPCIERNALGAIKAISSANLALSSSGKQKVSLDDAIRAMRLTAQGMRNEFKETSLSGLATSVPLNIPVSVPDC